jgi:hypothetical protein
MRAPGALRAFGRGLAVFLSREDGNATLEFTVLITPLLYIIFSIAELGVLMTRTVMVDRGTDIAVRDVRLGALPLGTEEVDGETLIGKPMKERVCEGAYLIANCVENLQIEMRPLDTDGDGLVEPTELSDSIDLSEVDCVDRNEAVNPVQEFRPGQRGELMLVVVCLVVDPLFPGVGLGAQLPTEADGGYAIVSRSAFLNEPN